MGALPSDRVLRLEERLAWFEKHALEQDKAVLELTEQVTRLRAEVRRLRERSESLADGMGVEAKEPPPPHY